MAKKRKWGGALAFGLVTAALGGYAAYKHRKDIERTLQEIEHQMDAWEADSDFFHDEEAVIHTVDPAPEAPAGEETQQETDQESDEPTEGDFADLPQQETEPTEA